MTPDTLLALLVKLAQAPACDVLSLGSAVGGTFTANETPYYVEHVATDAPGWSRVWLQQPTSLGTFEPRLSLEPGPGLCVTWEQAKARFGFAALVPGHPGRPSTPEQWWQYPEIKTARLSLGFDLQTGCLVKAALQARPASAETEAR